LSDYFYMANWLANLISHSKKSDRVSQNLPLKTKVKWLEALFKLIEIVGRKAV